MHKRRFIKQLLKQSHLKHPVLLAGLCALSLLIFTYAASKTPNPKQAQRPAPATERRKNEPSPEPKKNPSTPAATSRPAIVISNSPADVELGRNINRAIDESEFALAHWGIFITSLRDGRVLYARDGDRPFTPASNMKIYTTAVALDLLGADYHWRTSVYSAAEPDSHGTIAGNLILYGRGAPDLRSNQKKETPDALAQLADALYRRGVRRVRGDVVGDESYFRGEPLGDGWLWEDVQWYFGAEASALSINDNEVKVTITPTAKMDQQPGVKLEPATDYLHINNETNTVQKGQPATVGITRGLSDNELRVWGDFPLGGSGFSARIAVHHPALWAAELFKDELKARGISVEGEARAVDARTQKTDESFDSQHAVELASFTGLSLGQIVHATNKESINLNAELILRALGKERGSLAPEPNPRQMQLRGDDEAGLAVVRFWLNRAGIPTDTLALHDGSGLSRLDLVTPETTARLLAAMANSPAAGVFRDSLPVAGRDGTLEYRMRATAAGRIEAKTGTLTYTNSLSGYALTADDEPLVFSIMCNNETEKNSSIRVIDAIGSLLTSYRSSHP